MNDRRIFESLKDSVKCIPQYRCDYVRSYREPFGKIGDSKISEISGAARPKISENIGRAALISGMAFHMLDLSLIVCA